MVDVFNILDKSRSQFSIAKFGHNTDVDASSVPEDIWDGGGIYPWPAVAAATTIQSNSASDTAAGTGARTVRVFGLDTNGLEIQEDITLNGITPVALANQYFRVYRAFVITAGSTGANVGIVTIQHGATVIGQIDPVNNQSLMALFTIPADWPTVYILSWYAGLSRQSAGDITLQLLTRTSGQVFRVRRELSANSQGNTNFLRNIFLELAPLTDIVVRCVASSVNNADIEAGFDIGRFRS